MCGIAGILDFNGKVDENTVKKMADAIKHRGPDDEGYYFDNNIGLGHRRLSIIDLETGHQPMHNENKTIWIVYNGEIYNFKDLRKILEKSGHRFYTNSDTEVIIHSYEEWGPECVKKFNGQFAFAVWDSNKKILFLARDRFGIKPLYYWHKNGKFVFASEIKAILKDKDVERIPNDEIIYEYLVYGLHDHREETFFKGINRLLPAHYMIVEKSGIKKIKYWGLRIESGDDPKKFYKLFEESVKMRLMSEVPVGTCLSGGLDSSSIVCVVNKLLIEGGFEEVLGEKQKTFSAVYNGDKVDESKWIEKVVEKTGVENYKTFPSSNTLLKDLKNLIYYQEEPFGSTSIYAQYCVMREASKRVKVLLDGQGSDETLAGYIPYYGIYLKDLLKRKKYLTFFKEFILSIDLTYPFFKYVFQKGKTYKDLLNPKFYEMYKKGKFGRWEKTTNLNEKLMSDLLKYGIPHLLRYEDKNSMAFSIESRVPFLDHNLVEYLFSLPENQKLRNGWTKYILRKSMKGVLPEKIRKRRSKIGFATPEEKWIKEIHSVFKNIFESDSFKNRGYFNHKNILEKFELFVKGKKIDSKIFWRFFNLELWLREFIDKSR